MIIHSNIKLGQLTLHFFVGALCIEADFFRSILHIFSLKQIIQSSIPMYVRRKSLIVHILASILPQLWHDNEVEIFYCISKFNRTKTEGVQNHINVMM